MTKIKRTLGIRSTPRRHIAIASVTRLLRSTNPLQTAMPYCILPIHVIFFYIRFINSVIAMEEHLPAWTK